MNPPLADRIVPLTVILGASCWIALQLSRPVPQWDGESTEPPDPPAAVSSPRDEVGTGDYLRMVQWQLFRGKPRAGKDQDITPETAGTAPPTTPLRLTLQGVVLLPGGRSVAIIRDPAGKERAYRVGDALPGDAELRRIQARRVLLLHAGRLEALPLNHPVASSTPEMAQRRPPRRVVAVVPRDGKNHSRH